MKRGKAFLMATLLAASSLAGTSAWADSYHGHRHAPRVYAPAHGPHHHDRGPILFGTGLLLGSALWWATRPPAVVVEAAPVVVAPPPMVYSAPPPPNDGWWYYCRSSETYYPYVGRCAAPWERVAPH